MNAKILKLDEIETTSNLMNAVEMEEVLQFTKANQSQERALYLQTFEFGEIGFERKSDWMRLVNKLNKYDETQLINMITGRKKSSDWGGMIVSRADINYTEDGFQIDFAEPVQLLLETIGDKAVVVEVSQLKGEITYEWLHYRNSRHEELGGYAGILEVYIHNVEIIK